MASVRVTWVATPTEFPEGTPAAHHYTVHLGALSADQPVGVSAHEFPDVAPGDYPSSVETVAADGTVLAMHQGNSVHVPRPVLVPVGTTVNAALVAA